MIEKKEHIKIVQGFLRMHITFLIASKGGEATLGGHGVRPSLQSETKSP